MKFNFDCVFCFVQDLDRAVAFYRDVLGLRLESRDQVARFDVDGVRFELVPAPQVPSAGAGGNARLCLRVESVQEAVRHLRGQGVRTGPIERKPGGHLLTFQDPDNNQVCLWQGDGDPVGGGPRTR